MCIHRPEREVLRAVLDDVAHEVGNGLADAVGMWSIASASAPFVRSVSTSSRNGFASWRANLFNRGKPIVVPHAQKSSQWNQPAPTVGQRPHTLAVRAKIGPSSKLIKRFKLGDFE
jgi:hypothetical protein